MTLKNLLDLLTGLFGGGKKPSGTTENKKTDKSANPGNPSGSDREKTEPINPATPPETTVPEVEVRNNPAPQPADTTRKYLILREPGQHVQTLGTFNITEGNTVLFTCKTIELPWRNNEKTVSCIPDGSYRTVRHNSPKYGQCFWLQDVPGRSEILIHHGNYAASINPRTGTPDTKGCILPGESHADVNNDGILDVTASVNTMKKLRELLPDEFQLEIRTRII